MIWLLGAVGVAGFLAAALVALEVLRREAPFPGSGMRNIERMRESDG